MDFFLYLKGNYGIDLVFSISKATTNDVLGFVDPDYDSDADLDWRGSLFVMSLVSIMVLSIGKRHFSFIVWSMNLV